MASFSYDHVPGDTVFVVTQDSYVREATILQVQLITYLDSDDVTQDDLEYLVEFNDDTTIILPPEVVFDNIDDALNLARTNVTT